MEFSADILASGVVGTLIVLAAIGQYIRSRKDAAQPKLDPTLQVIGAEYGSREQMERLISETARIADALENKNTMGINNRLDSLAERFDQLMELERGKGRR